MIPVMLVVVMIGDHAIVYNEQYRIVQNVGGVKLWRIDRFRVLARKTLANLQ